MQNRNIALRCIVIRYIYGKREEYWEAGCGKEESACSGRVSPSSESVSSIQRSRCGGGWSAGATVSVVTGRGRCAGAEPPTIAYVANRLFLRHNSAVELVDRTEQQGLLEREVDADDHRKILLRLTRRGEELLASLVILHMEELKKWGPEMIEVLRRLTGEANGAATQRPVSRN